MSGRAAASFLRASLVAFAGLRLAALLMPSMDLWGLNHGRFTAPWIGFSLWILPAMALVPALGRRLDDSIETAGAAASARGIGMLVAIAVALPLFLMPDGAWFVGDFLLREGAMREAGDFRRMFPQAQPLDILLHHRLPHALLALGLDTTLAARMIGALEAGVLALLALRFARGFALRGAAAAAVGSAVFAGGYLALFAGYAKPTVEVCVLAVAVGVFGIEMVREGRSHLAASLAFIAALALHRSALSLLPGLALFWVLALRRHRIPPAHRAEIAFAAITLAAALAWFIPRLWQLFRTFDLATNFVSYEVERQGGPLAAAFSGLRLLDLANLALLHVPLLLTLPTVAMSRANERDRPPAGIELVALAGLFAGHLPAILFTYVTQGPFRDWDAHAGGFAALALLVAGGLAAFFENPASREAARGLASACVLAVIAPTLTVIAAQHDLGGSLRRAQAFLDGPPARTESQRLATLDYLGLRNLRLERFADATRAFTALAADAPHPRALVLRGTSALLAGDDPAARDAFSSLLARDSSQSVAWFGLWLAAARSGDTTLARSAERRVLAYPDTSPDMDRILGHLQHYPGLWRLLPANLRAR